MADGLKGDEVVTNIGGCLSCSSMCGEGWELDAVQRVSPCSCIFMVV